MNTNLKVRKNETPFVLRGSLLVLTFVLGANAWLHTFRPGMVVPDGPEVTRMSVPDAPDVVPDASDPEW